MKRHLIFFTLAASLCFFCGADWLQFRGTRHTNIASDSKLPISFADSDNVEWKVDLPGRGPSSPIIVDDRVVVTCSGGLDDDYKQHQDHLHILCFDAKSGKELWRRRFWATGRTHSHPFSANAAPTPASDGKSIFAFYSSNDLVCLDLEGNLKWYRGLAHDYPKTGNDVGMSSSPVVLDGVVIVQIENQGDSFASGIDTETGEELWRVSRKPAANWASPVVLPGSGNRKSGVLLQDRSGVVVLEPRTGKELWSFDTPCGGVSSSLLIGNRLYLPSNGVTALDLSDESSAPAFAWDSNKLRPDSASPIVYRDQIYTVDNAGILKCGSTKDGKVNWQLRLKGKFWATPLAAGDHLYLVNQEGLLQVVAIGGKGKLAASSNFGEPILGTPAVAGDAMFVRSDKHLWKIASPQ